METLNQATDDDVYEDSYSDLVCRHIRSEIRKREIAGQFDYFRQCVTCGLLMVSIPRNDPAIAACSDIGWFQDGLRESWIERVIQHQMRARQKRSDQITVSRSAWRQKYEEYLKSPAWRKKRAVYLDRLPHGLCEGCGVNLATEVHHLTYKNLGNEFLWELRALCHTCHQRVHPSKDMSYD